jgi:hypothetical protein
LRQSSQQLTAALKKALQDIHEEKKLNAVASHTEREKSE